MVTGEGGMSDDDAVGGPAARAGMEVPQVPGRGADAVLTEPCAVHAAGWQWARCSRLLNPPESVIEEAGRVRDMGSLARALAAVLRRGPTAAPASNDPGTIQERDRPPVPRRNEEP